MSNIKILGNGDRADLFNKVKREPKEKLLICNMPPFEVTDVYASVLVDFKMMKALTEGQLNLDAYKGSPVNYRPWDNQLRQPILLHTYNAVTERAPIRGFLHPTENMDSLGYDQGDRRCQF